MTYTRYWRAQPVKSDKVKLPQKKLEKFLGNLQKSIQGVQGISLPKDLVIAQPNSIKPTIDCSAPENESGGHIMKLPSRVIFELAKNLREYKNGYGRAEGQREVEQWMELQKDETIDASKWMGNVLHGQDVMGMEQDVRELLNEGTAAGETENDLLKTTARALHAKHAPSAVPYEAIAVMNGVTECMKRAMLLLGKGEYIVPQVSTPELKRVWQYCATSLKTYQYRSSLKKDPWDNEPDPEPPLPPESKMTAAERRKAAIRRRRRARNQKKHDAFLCEWRLNLKEMFSHISEETKAIFINYPCPVTGAVWNRQSLHHLIEEARKHCIPLIVNQQDFLLAHSRRVHSDFSSAELQLYTIFEDIGRIQAQKRVPVFTISSISESHLVKGWQLAWLCLFDSTEGVMKRNRFVEAFNNCRELRKEPSTFLQLSLPHLLSSKVEQLYVNRIRRHCELNFRFLKGKLDKIDGISMKAMPESGLYVPLCIDVRSFDSWIRDDETFCNLFMEEESVKVIPAGTQYGMKNYFLVSLFVDRVLLRRALERLEDFSLIHFVRSNK